MLLQHGRATTIRGLSRGRTLNFARSASSAAAQAPSCGSSTRSCDAAACSADAPRRALHSVRSVCVSACQQSKETESARALLRARQSTHRSLTSCGCLSARASQVVAAP